MGIKCIPIQGLRKTQPTDRLTIAKAIDWIGTCEKLKFDVSPGYSRKHRDMLRFLSSQVIP
jgi:hypothetical protein